MMHVDVRNVYIDNDEMYIGVLKVSYIGIVYMFGLSQ